MKLLGHAWVAVNARPEGDRKLLMLGSILPEIMYYTKDQPFEFEEIHEGGNKVYQYLRSKNPKWADLGLGMLAHSVKSGADKFNFEENLAILGYERNKVDKLRRRLTEILDITYETAKTRAHNILELAVELRIIRENPVFVNEFNEAIADRKLREKIKRILTDCFHKSPEAVSRSINELFDKAKPDYFKSAEGLADLWTELSREFDPPPDKKRLARLLQDLSEGYEGRDRVFLRECIDWVRGNLQTVSAYTERK